MRAFKCIFNGFVIGMFAAVLASKSVWLEMRMNLGYVIFGVWALITAISLFLVYSGTQRNLFNWITTLVILAAALAGSLIALGPARLTRVPASLLREGLSMSGVPLTTWNILLLVVMILSTILIVAYDFKQGSMKTVNGKDS